MIDLPFLPGGRLRVEALSNKKNKKVKGGGFSLENEGEERKRDVEDDH